MKAIADSQLTKRLTYGKFGRGVLPSDCSHVGTSAISVYAIHSPPTLLTERSDR